MHTLADVFIFAAVFAAFIGGAYLALHALRTIARDYSTDAIARRRLAHIKRGAKRY